MTSARGASPRASAICARLMHRHATDILDSTDLFWHMRLCDNGRYFVLIPAVSPPRVTCHVCAYDEEAESRASRPKFSFFRRERAALFRKAGAGVACQTMEMSTFSREALRSRRVVDALRYTIDTRIISRALGSPLTRLDDIFTHDTNTAICAYRG